jgi:hypothetical protein
MRWNGLSGAIGRPRCVALLGVAWETTAAEFARRPACELDLRPTRLPVSSLPVMPFPLLVLGESCPALLGEPR